MTDLFQIFNAGVADLPAAALFFVFFFGTFVSEDAACIAAGAAVAGGRMDLLAAVAACFIGIFAGDMLLYGAGRAYGEKIFDSRLVRRFVSIETRRKAASWLERNGASAVFLSRFVTGLRLPTYLAAGALKTDLVKFTLYFLLASAIWTPVLVGAAAYSQTAIFQQYAILGLIALFIVVRFSLKFSSWRNRRLLVGRLKRIARWEFWPVQIFYVPVVIYVFWLALRYRSLTVFTAVNPAIPAGGFKGESKNDIYASLARSGASQAYLLRHVLIPRSCSDAGRLKMAWRFIDHHSLSFPLVIKPDAGERGRNVCLLRTYDDLADAVRSANSDMILQQYAPGEELSIFYYRYPNDKNGSIFSITEKRFPGARGDGVSTIEDLILSDPRAVCLADKYFEENSRILDHVPAAGEFVRLIDIGTHSRGAVFLDGGHLLTEKLLSRIDQICRHFDGFNFGRFDIRAGSLDDLREGLNFKIIELNGVTSESTNIYDPRYSLLDAYRILFRQWRIAFEIGAENIKLGAKASGLFDILRMTFGMPVRETEAPDRRFITDPTACA